MMTAETVVAIVRRLSPEDYAAEREKIRETYGDSARDRKGLYEQALAALFYRSGWTQEELAKKEGVAKSQMSRRLLFGKFLAYSPTGGNLPKLPPNVTERRFRKYWERTSGTNERQRFTEVGKMIEANTRVCEPPLHKTDLAKAIIEKYADSKWHPVSRIANELKVFEDEVDAILKGMIYNKAHGCFAEKQMDSYKITKGATSGKRQYAEGGHFNLLVKELRPILKELKVEGKQTTVTISPNNVYRLAVMIEQLLEKFAE